MRITRSTICGTDSHIIKGGVPTVQPGTVLGHEATGVVTEVGNSVQNVKPGDRILAVCVVPAATAGSARPASTASA